VKSIAGQGKPAPTTLAGPAVPGGTYCRQVYAQARMQLGQMQEWRRILSTMGATPITTNAYRWLENAIPAWNAYVAEVDRTCQYTERTGTPATMPIPPTLPPAPPFPDLGTRPAAGINVDAPPAQTGYVRHVLGQGFNWALPLENARLIAQLAPSTPQASLKQLVSMVGGARAAPAAEQANAMRLAERANLERQQMAAQAAVTMQQGWLPAPSTVPGDPAQQAQMQAQMQAAQQRLAAQLGPSGVPADMAALAASQPPVTLRDSWVAFNLAALWQAISKIDQAVSDSTPHSQEEFVRVYGR
jgi:hypothetical protein